MPEKNYARRDIVDKLGIRQGHAVLFVQGQEAREIDLELQQRILARTERDTASEGELADIILAFVDTAQSAAELLTRWKQRLKPAGAIWLLSTKRGQATYLDQRELIEAGGLAGLVDNKICSVSATTSAMRFVIRKKDRAKA